MCKSPQTSFDHPLLASTKQKRGICREWQKLGTDHTCEGEASTFHEQRAAEASRISKLLQSREYQVLRKRKPWVARHRGFHVTVTGTAPSLPSAHRTPLTLSGLCVWSVFLHLLTSLYSPHSRRFGSREGHSRPCFCSQILPKCTTKNSEFNSSSGK